MLKSSVNLRNLTNIITTVICITGERWEWIKPIMFSGGIGSIESKFCDKNKPAKDMLVTKIGGPVYRIGVGGGAASSIQVQGKHY